MYGAIGIIVAVIFTVGFIIGRNKILKKIRRDSQRSAQIVKDLNGQKSVLVRQLKICRERSSDRREKILQQKELLSEYKEENKELRKKLYAYKERYGELND